MAREPANKAPKKMGRPKGSKNNTSFAKNVSPKNADSGILASFGRLAFDTQEAVLAQMSSMYEGAKHSRAAELMAELSRLGISTGKKRGRPTSYTNGAKSRRRLPGQKVQARFRSKQDPSMTWAGRGLMPKWMKEEMKGTKLTKEDFAI